MTRHPARSLSARHVLSALVLFTPLLFGRAALAQQACGDTTCPKGFSCEMETAGCAAVECVGELCQPCVPDTVLVCRPGPCSADADCAEDMACADVEQSSCADAAEAPACIQAPCPEMRPEGTCTTTASKQCLPRWALACAVDADCGAGFSCKEQEQCSCSGSTGTGTSGSSGSEAGAGGSPPGAADPALPAPMPSGSGAPPAPTPSECTCAPSGQKACEAILVACTSDAGCPSGWSCRDNPEGACWSDSNGNTGCTPADPAKLCLPPYSDFVSGGGFGEISTDGSGLPTASGKGSSATGAAESGSPSGGGGGGCSIGNGRSGSSRDVFAWCLALGAALGLGRRARRQRKGSTIAS